MTKIAKKKYIAILTDENGQDRLGTDYVVRGEYVSYDNFVRYAFKRQARPNAYGTYNVYAYSQSLNLDAQKVGSIVWVKGY